MSAIYLQIPESMPILASEPADAWGAVSEKALFMPILDMKASSTRVFACGLHRPRQCQCQGWQTARLKTGIALVIDTTISMKPYIDQSLNVVRKIYDEIEKGHMADNVGFAVVAFRSSTKAVPGLEYTTEVVSDFATAKTAKALKKIFQKCRKPRFQATTLTRIRWLVCTRQLKPSTGAIIPHVLSC